MERVRIVFSGAGGQGVITAAILIAEAAVLYEDLIAVQSQSYGPEARGGATRSDVIISDTEIFFPKVIQPNVLVCLSQEAYNKYYGIIRPGGILLTDSRHVKTVRKVDARQKELPMYSTVMDNLEKAVVFNICMLGVIIGYLELINPDSIMKVLEKRLPKGLIEMNRKALELGLELAQKNPL